MNSLRKLRNTIRRPAARRNAQLYIYTPLPGNKPGYIIEYRQRHFSQLFYYKYKENADGTLTKYGYLINGNNNNDGYNNGDGSGDHNKSKGLWANRDKDCIFYQTVADKTQIDLEHRWLDEIRTRGRWEVPVSNDEEDLNDEYKEWEDVMQHNNKVFISDSIQRRRVAEVLSNVENCCGMEHDLSSKHNDPPKNEDLQKKTTASQNTDNPTITNTVNPTVVEGRLRPNQLPPLTTIQTTQFSIPSDSQPPHRSHKYNDSLSTTSSTNSIPPHVIKNYITYTPPISPKTPPGTPIDSSVTIPKSLLNINVRQREKQRQQLHHKQQIANSNNDYDADGKDNATNDNKPKKLVHLTHPKFSKIPPQVRIYDPEELLLFRDCRCDYCMIGGYNG